MTVQLQSQTTRKGEPFLWHGYISIHIPKHPHSNKQGHVKMHRFVYETYKKCCLLPTTVIHHINEIKTDNRIENLRPIISNVKHMELHKPNIDYANRFCVICDSNQTTIIKNTKSGKRRWYHYGDEFVCHYCYRFLKWRGMI